MRCEMPVRWQRRKNKEIIHFGEWYALCAIAWSAWCAYGMGVCGMPSHAGMRSAPPHGGVGGAPWHGGMRGAVRLCMVVSKQTHNKASKGG